MEWTQSNCENKTLSFLNFVVVITLLIIPVYKQIVIMELGSFNVPSGYYGKKYIIVSRTTGWPCFWHILLLSHSILSLF